MQCWLIVCSTSEGENDLPLREAADLQLKGGRLELKMLGDGDFLMLDA